MITICVNTSISDETETKLLAKLPKPGETCFAISAKSITGEISETKRNLPKLPKLS